MANTIGQTCLRVLRRLLRTIISIYPRRRWKYVWALLSPILATRSSKVWHRLRQSPEDAAQPDPNQVESGTQNIECCCADRSGRVPTHNIKSVLAEVVPKASSVKGWAVVHQEGLAVPSWIRDQCAGLVWELPQNFNFAWCVPTPNHQGPRCCAPLFHFHVPSKHLVIWKLWA